MTTRLFLVVAPAILCATTPSFADHKVWVGGPGATDWHVGLNWSGGTVPTANDTVYIGPGIAPVEIAAPVTIDSIVCERSLYARHNFLIKHNSAFYGRLTTTGGLSVETSNTIIDIFGTYNWNASFLSNAIGAINTTIRIQSGAVMNVTPGASPLQCNIEVLGGGTLNVSTVGLRMYDDEPSTIVLSCQSGGAINFTGGGNVTCANGQGAVINYGRISVSGAPTNFESSVYFYNAGVLNMRANTYIGDPAFIAPGYSMLVTGTYDVDNCSFAVNPNRSFKGVGPSARLNLFGPNASIANSDAMQINQGEIYATNGALFTVGSLGQFGFWNAGTLYVGPGGRIHSYTTFANGSNATMMNLATGTGLGQYGVYSSANQFYSYGGNAYLVAFGGYVPNLGDRIPFVRLSLQSPIGVGGSFVNVIGSGWSSASIHPTLQSAVRDIDFVLACDADFNGDGFVDGFDYDDFVACFEGVGCPPEKSADFNGDGFADGFDYDGFVFAFELGCS